MSNPKEYHVSWEIDLYAESPREAAERALAIQRNPDSMATVFVVADEEGNIEHIDLKDGTDDQESRDPKKTQAQCDRCFQERLGRDLLRGGIETSLRRRRQAQERSLCRWR
jgi:hypothetical protein